MGCFLMLAWGMWGEGRSSRHRVLFWFALADVELSFFRGIVKVCHVILDRKRYTGNVKVCHVILDRKRYTGNVKVFMLFWTRKGTLVN